MLFHCITDDRIEQFPIGQLISMLEVSGKSLADSKSMDSKVVYSSLRKIVMILEKREGDIATVAMKVCHHNHCLGILNVAFEEIQC